jgi:hypothetical protein
VISAVSLTDMGVATTARTQGTSYGTPQLRGPQRGRVSHMTRPVEIPAQGRRDAPRAGRRLASPTFAWHEC